jgi:hypothetical protein
MKFSHDVSLAKNRTFMTSNEQLKQRTRFFAMTSNEHGKQQRRTRKDSELKMAPTRKRGETQPAKGEDTKVRRDKRIKTEEDDEGEAGEETATEETPKEAPVETAQKAKATVDDAFKLEFREVMKSNPLRFNESSAAQSVEGWDTFIVMLGEMPCYDFHKHQKRDCTCLQNITTKERAAIVSTLAPLTMFPRDARADACALLVKERRNKMHRSEFLFPMPESEEMVRVCVFRFRALVDLTGQTTWKKAREIPKKGAEKAD